MTWQITTPRIGAQPIADVSATQNHPLGFIVQAKDPIYGAGEFIYVVGATNVVPAAKSWCFYNADDGAITPILANGIGPVGIAMSAIIAGTYGWLQITGKALGACLTQMADNGRVCLTSTSFAVDDASVTGDLIANAKGASLTGVDSGYAEFEIARPFATDSLSTGG